MRDYLQRAMQQPDDLVVELDYMDSQGRQTRRVVSPIRFMPDDNFLALCLCREQPRQFNMSRCRNPRLIPAANVIMPMPFAEPLRKFTGRKPCVAESN